MISTDTLNSSILVVKKIFIYFFLKNIHPSKSYKYLNVEAEEFIPKCN